MNKATKYLIITILVLTLIPVAHAKIVTQDDIIKKINEDGEAKVIVRILDEPPTIIKGEVKLSNKAEKTLEKTYTLLNNEITNKKTLQIINGFSGTLTKDGLKALESSGTSYIIEEDSTLHILPSKNPDGLTTQLDTSTNATGATYVWTNLNYTGRNITIAIIDTGIYYNHTDLGNCFGDGCKVKGGWDFFYDDADPIDNHGHGTHVAGIAAANGTIKGMAPDAELYALQACGDTDAEGCSESAIIQSLEWAVNNSADIASISIGGGIISSSVSNTGKDSLSQAVDTTVEAGIIVVVAAGNDGNGTSTINNPGSAEKAVTVGNAYDLGTQTHTDDYIISGSSKGPGGFGRIDPDISAPGTLINSTWKTGGYQTLTGTSMATPHVSGATALLLEAYPELTPSQTRAMLMGSATNITGKTFEKGAGELNIQAAIQNNIYATITGQNSYLQETSNDRWETIAIPWETNNATLTITNNLPYNINFSTTSFTPFENMEDSDTLNTSNILTPEEILATASSNTTLEINYTFDDMSQYTKTTYGGSLILQGTYDNGTDNVSVNLTIPVAITLPMINYFQGSKTMDDSGTTVVSYYAYGDNYAYAYYNNNSGNDSFFANWTSTSDDLDLFIYNSSGNLDVSSARASTNNEAKNSTKVSTIKWFRIYGYEFAEPITFDLNITDIDNSAPAIIAILNASGQDNFTTYNGSNSTITAYYQDANSDILTAEINDSRYNISNSTTNSTTWYWETNETSIGNYTVKITVTDPYNKSSEDTVLIIILNTTNADPIITSYEPSNLAPSLEKNNSLQFNITASDPNDLPLNYTWLVNETLNSTEQNFTFNSTQYTAGIYNITIIVNNNNTESGNATLSWTLSITEPETAPAEEDDGGSSGGGSGGGGGGGGSAGPLTRYSKIIQETNGTINITHNHTAIPIKQLDIALKSNLKDIKITLNSLKENPAEASNIQEKIYKTLEISHDNLENRDIKSVLISFSVERNWTKNNSVSKDNIALQRYSNDKWNLLETKYKRFDSNYYYYEATSPGLSLFAITELLPQTIEPEPVEKNLTQPPLRLLDNTTNETIKESSEEQVKKSKSAGWLVLPILCILTIIAIIAVRIKRNKK